MILCSVKLSGLLSCAAPRASSKHPSHANPAPPPFSSIPGILLRLLPLTSSIPKSEGTISVLHSGTACGQQLRVCALTLMQDLEMAACD